MPQTKESKKKDVFDNLNEEKVLFEWEAAERSFKKRDRDFWITAISILVLVAVILIFVKEFFLIVALGSVLFLFYVLTVVPPGKIKNKITNRAIYFGEVMYDWSVLKRFWFEKSLNSQMVSIETNLRFPRQVSLVINPKNKAKIKKILLKKIPLIENSPTFVDKLTAWMMKKLPLEDRK